ncbi:unnamed protein product [Clavelina lepadiformis]|uniref:Uncharacterized protein n=1 Tax=Clavelina lepadiformis TaxID=159417 RepID=A0ABP0FVJ0_CLALP
MAHHSACLKIWPEPSIFDEQVTISVEGLVADQPYTLYSHVTTYKNLAFECISHYTSDSRGKIDLTKQESTGGYYRGVEAMGLFWGMKPSLRNWRSYPSFIQGDVSRPLKIVMKVFPGNLQTSLEIDSRNCLAENVSTRYYLRPGGQRFVIRDDGLHAFLYTPANEGRFPGVISIGGSFPGTNEGIPALLASHGYVSMGLPYVGLDGLPDNFSETSMNFSYFEAAYRFMTNHKMVQSEKGIAIVTHCMGIYSALALATFLPNIRCVIADNGPIFATHQAMIYKGEPLTPPIKPTKISPRRICPQTGNVRSRHSVTYPSFTEMESSLVLPFYKRHKTSYMFVASMDDDGVASEFHTNIAEKLLKKSGHPDYKILRYPGAGHELRPPFTPHIEASYMKTVDSVLMWGGVTSVHCKAQKDFWKEQLLFLQRCFSDDFAPSSKL